MSFQYEHESLNIKLNTQTKMIELKKCIECGHALVPTARGWVCDNIDCKFEYGIDVLRTEGMEQLSDAIQRNIGKVDYRVNDLALELEQLRTQSETIRNHLSDIGIKVAPNTKNIAERLISEFKFNLDLVTEERDKYKTVYDKISKTWWFKLFNMFKPYGLIDCPINMIW